MDQVYQVGPVANVEGHFTAFSAHAKALGSFIVQSNVWDLFLVKRPLFDKVAGFNLVLEEIIFISETDISTGVSAKNLVIADDFDSNQITVNWVDLNLNAVGAVGRIGFSGGLNNRIILGNLTCVDSSGSGVVAGIVHVAVIGHLIPEFS